MLVEALWRVVRRDGIGGMTVRSVAAEAGTSPGALRHHFASQDQFAAFALQAVVDRITERIMAGLPSRSGRDAAVFLLEQMLPLDDARRDEMAVYLAFLGRPPTEERLQAIRYAADSGSRKAVSAALRMLADAGRMDPSRDRAVETDRLYALVDGLGLHGTLWPERYPPAHQRAVLEEYLRSLEP
jgi:AcrR family transcriptional regulator